MVLDDGSTDWLAIERFIEDEVEVAYNGGDKDGSGEVGELTGQAINLREDEKDKIRDEVVREYVLMEYGERCKEYQEGCPTCDEWKLYDDWLCRLERKA